MSEFKIQMPKMGESVQEATITKWFVKEGDKIEEDDMLFEIATEKVDSEIPSPVDGVIKKILFEVDSIVPVGEIVAIIQTDEDGDDDDSSSDEASAATDKEEVASTASEEKAPADFKESTRFYSPLVRSIAKEENISLEVLETIEGSGAGGRVQKQDVLDYLAGKGAKPAAPAAPKAEAPAASAPKEKPAAPKPSIPVGADDKVIEMDRIRKIISERMVQSVSTAPHVTSVVETDVTNVVLWRNKVKDEFQAKFGQKLTFMPVFIEAAATALREFPMLNASVDGDKIILRGKVNIGVAVAKPDGNLIVPVIKDADQKNLVGLTSSMNDLANRARINKLTPDEISGGTFSISNFGTFKNDIGTPIINQPEVAILATGNIVKKPAVLETPAGDVIAIRHKMFLSVSYDHRIIDGALGGAFLRRIAELLEEFDVNRKI
ncbi:dihydrolipoamide acetyltransferase family protein [Mangrovibacterium diazotrophicum]|uniref:Dihydrolipoamide acetyltransferase component of pyruvate dehydrogenase complex n=1 Tax=Mangrovibacterium diazotrophicum TaxID=1261403 RepID=A0A419W3K7_9BACT|nr:dihydrolipoamide acetyltransferase family protein [Mangrovibacterium diazotrophicum]RKD90071.1 2-oxoglutarate dehydrogenase E2 component (dihydrolipoamide succinyltransferase) [Mangrovibacterium diazotrophicum]